jgi:hypothetical protein
MKNIGWLTSTAPLAILLALGGCGSDSSQKASGSTNASEPPAPAKIVAKDVDNHASAGDGFDLIVGHSHHVMEASTNEADARMIIHAREGKIETFDKSPAGVISEMYAKDTYRHYGNDEAPPAPLCNVNEQDPVEVDNYEDAVINLGQPKEPVACTLEDGTVFYVSAWEK